MKNRKKALLKSALSLLLCLSMLIGSTFAWFTDSVTSSGNVITSGSLDIAMYWTDDLDSGVWYDVEDGAHNTVFSYDNWEPGYTDVKYIKLVNEGNLALNYKLTLTPQNGVGKLADVINVYFANRAVDMDERIDLDELRAIGLLTSVLNGGATASGTLLASGQQSELHPSGEVVMTLAMNMITTAGNEYMDEESGEFTITALATQAAAEKDSFGSNYDGSATYPQLINGNAVTVTFNPENGKVPAGGVTMQGETVSAYAPAGVLMENGADQLTLSVTPLQNTTSDITVVNNEILIPVDVHIDGVSENNTTPIIVDLGEILPKYLNMGNYHLYHVEDGENKVMTLVNSRNGLTAHNTFTYDPMTGAVSVAMATFSEVALVADTSCVWEGNIATEFGGGSGTAADPYLIANADQFAYFNECISNSNDKYADKCYKLLSDINIDGADDGAKFYPIGYRKVLEAAAAIGLDNAPTPIYEVNEETTIQPAATSVSTDDTYYTYGGAFKGVFDGNGHTISNIYQNTWAMKGDYDGHYWNDAMGVFGYVYGGTVKNLTVDNFESDGEFTPTGVVAAYAANATFENIAITHCNPRVYNTGNGGIVGIGGNSADTADKKMVFKNITIDNTNKISALWGSWDVACGGLMGMFRGYSEVSFNDCHTAAQIDVYNDVCGNYQYYWYRYSGMMIGSLRGRNTTDADGYTVPDMTGITAKNCTVRFAEWNDYYYCELVANTLASYTHDHQFSRLTQVDSVNVNAKTYVLDGKTYNIPTNGSCHYVTLDGGWETENATCYHFVNGEQHFHEDAGTEIVNGKEVLKENNQHIHLPFNQLFQGDGWGVKHVPIYDDGTGFEGITILDRVGKTNVKFEGIAEGKEFDTESTVTIGELFKMALEDAKNPIKSDRVKVFVSPLGEDSTVRATYVANASDWTKGTLTFAGYGAAAITITDYYYCVPTVMKVNVNDKKPVDKFFGSNAEADVYDEIKLGDLFTAESVKKDVTVTVVDPDGVESTISATAANWMDKTIALSKAGEWKVTIQENDKYCLSKEIAITVNKADKFTAKGDGNFEAYTFTEIALGDLFTGKNVNKSVVVTLEGPNGTTTFTVDAAEWAEKTISLSKAGPWTVTIKEDDKYCLDEQVAINAKDAEKFSTKFTNDYLYRVGNANAVNLGLLFQDDLPDVKRDVTVTVEKVSGNASGVYTSNATWTNGTIQFSGTGVVRVTISADGANAVELLLEVVDATNLTSATGTTTGGTFVLLCDVNTSTYVNYWDCTLYGNGFTYSLKGAPTAYNSKQGHGVIITKNATLDNVQIIGDVYNAYGAYTNQDYYNTAVDAVGDTTIQNSYIANCAAPVKARSNITIKNTTLYGGTVANLLIMSGTATLEDVTTANFDDGRSLVGMGIVIHSDATETAKLVLNGTLKQYNFISESKVPSDSYAKNLHDAMFNSKCSQYQFGTSPNRYVNAGIISLTSTFNGEDITDNAKTGYTGQALTVSSYNGYVYTQSNTSGSVNNNCGEYKPNTQGPVAPTYSFDYTNKNYIAKTEGSNDYCYEENGKVNISMDEGDTFNWDTSILTIGKGVTSYTVAMNGTDYTGKSIAFNTAGDYAVTYTYTDANNNALDANGNVTTYSATYTKTVNITVAVVKATTKHAEFTFGSSNTASTTVTVGNSTYVMPNVSGTSSTVGSKTVNGQTIYYPIVEIIMSDGKTSHSSGWYAYFPVFSGAVTITDYANGGTGDAMTPYNGSTTAMPSGLSIVGDPTQLFKYQSASAAGSSPVVKNNKLVYSSASISAKREEYNTVVEYTYTDNAGATYHYYIGYHAPAQSYSSCVTPDTLVTLADGTQKRIDQVTYADELLVWDFVAGEYVTRTASIVMNHGYDNYEIVTLNFDNGTTVNTINGHGFFSAEENKFVVLDKDNAEAYVGQSFIVDAEKLTEAKLISYSIKTEYTESWSILTAEDYNCILEGMLTLTPAEVAGSPDYLMPYAIGDDMKYIAEDKQADIEKYGLYTYDDFADYITYEQYTALGLADFKVAVGKGYITWEEILYLLQLHTK